MIVLGDIVTPDRVLHDGALTVTNGQIQSIQPAEQLSQASLKSTDVRDFTGRLVLPGFIDAHVHSFSGPGEGWEHSSLAAASGGVTTIIEMPYDAAAPVINEELFTAKRHRIQGSSLVDVALLGTIAKQAGTGAVEAMIKAGACGFKVSLFETDPKRFPRISANDLFDLMSICAPHGVVVGFHAEDTEIIESLVSHYRATAPRDPLSHCRSRPPVAENLATAFALQLAHDTGCPVHIYHASLDSVIELVTRYRSAGTDATAETCPHYLLLDEQDMPRLGALGKINPPLRSARERELLWQRLCDGDIDMVTSDHAPWPLERKSADVIFDNSSGTPGVDLVGPLLLGEGYLGGRLSLLHAVGMLTSAPARRFGLDTTKGSLAEGMDADMCVLDPTARQRISGLASFSSAGWSPYEGLTIPGRIEATFVRGTEVYRDGKITAGLDHGRFVAPVRSKGPVP